MNKYFQPNTKKAIKLATFIKGVTATMTTAAYIIERPTAMFVIMIIGAIANETINFLSDASDPKTRI